MSNTNTVFGARLHNAPWSKDPSVGTYLVVATDATAMYVGDFVKLTGESAIWTDGVYYPVVTQAAAGDIVVGWVDSFEPHHDYLNQIYRTASTLRLAKVINDPNAFLEIQSTGTGAVGDIGQTANIIVASGNTFTGLSGMQLDHGSLTDNLQLKILYPSPRVGAELGAYTKFICKINTNKHAYSVSTGV